MCYDGLSGVYVVKCVCIDIDQTPQFKQQMLVEHFGPKHLKCSSDFQYEFDSEINRFVLLGNVQVI